MAWGGNVNKYAVGGGVNYFLNELFNPETTISRNSIKDKKTGKYRLNMASDLPLEAKLFIEQAAEKYGLKNLIQGYTPNTGNKFAGGLKGEDFEKKLAFTTLGEEDYNKIKDNPNAIREVAYKAIGFKPTGTVDYNNPEFYNQFKKAFESKIPENMRPAFGSTGPMGLDYWNALKMPVKPKPIPVVETPGEKVANPTLGSVDAVLPTAKIPQNNRFNFGLLNKQLNYGLDANERATQELMGLNPIYQMETPDTYIRSRKSEIPIGNILYNIEKAQRNTANALADQTGDWSTLAGNIANAGANAYNQIGDTLTAINEKNVGLYNTKQDLEQKLLGENMDIRNQNLYSMQDILNKKKNLLAKKYVSNSELMNNYYKSMMENQQQEQNQKLNLLGTIASKPDMFRGEQGQQYVNQVLGTTGSYDNPFVGTIFDMFRNK
jgi:hypothetical protein